MQKKNKKNIHIEGEKGKRLILTENHSLIADGSADLNTLVIGGAGSGKFRSFIEPNMQDLPDDTSFVITDPDGEIWKETHEKMEKA